MTKLKQRIQKFEMLTSNNITELFERIRKMETNMLSILTLKNKLALLSTKIHELEERIYRVEAWTINMHSGVINNG